MKIIFLRHLDQASRSILRQYRVWALPPIQIKSLNWKPSQKSYDFILVSSVNAVQSLRALKEIKTRAWIAIGTQTARALKDQLRVRPRVLSESNSDGIYKFLKKEVKKTANPLKILHPTSNLSDRKLKKRLHNLSIRLETKRAYETKILNLNRPLKKILSRETPDAVFVFSPSGFKAVAKVLKKKALQSLNIKWICIGPTTAKALKKAGLRPHFAKKPRLREMLVLAKKALRNK